MVKFFDRAWMNVASAPSTGTITLGTAETGYQTFADAGAVDADEVRYTIIDGTDWEVGVGTYTASGTTLSRTLGSSSTGSLLDASADATVFATAAAADIVDRDNAVYDVAKYGAVLDGTTDDTAAIVAAAADLRAAGKGTLWFPPGRKCLVSYYPHAGFTDDVQRTVLLFNETGLDVEVDLNGCEIIFDGANRSEYGHFIFEKETGPTARLKVHGGGSFRYKSPPFTIGAITAISAGSHIDVAVDSAPTFTDVQRVRNFKEGQFEGQPYAYNQLTWNAGGALTDQGGGVWRLDISDAGATVVLDDLLVGDVVALEHHIYNANVITSVNSGDVLIDDLDIYHAAGTGVRVIKATQCVIGSGVRLLTDPALQVPHSVLADGLHVKCCRTTIIRGPHVYGTGDDCIHVNSMADDVISRDSDTQFSATTNAANAQPRVGDLIQIVDDERVLMGETRITSVDVASTGNGTSYTVSVADTLPAGMGTTWEAVQAAEVAVISGVSCGFNRGRGIVGSAREFSVTDNETVRTSQFGMGIINDHDEYTAVKSATFHGNRIRRANLRSTGARVPAAFSITASDQDNNGATTEILENISVTNNVVDTTNNCGFALYGISGLVFQGNVCVDIGLNGQAIDSFSAGLPLILKNVDQAFISGNVLADTTVGVVQGQDVSNIVWGQNVGMEPSTGTNAFTYTSPKGFFAAIDAADDITSLATVRGNSLVADAATGGDVVISATATAGNDIRHQAVLSGTGAWYWGVDASDFAKFKLSWQSADFSSSYLAMRRDNGFLGLNTTTPQYRLTVKGTFCIAPGSSVAPTDNGDVVIEATDNTTLTFKLKGDDGTVRSGTLTLA